MPDPRVPQTDPPFLDPDPISEKIDADLERAAVYNRADDLAPDVPRETSGPCADCTRYAQVGYVIGAAVGITAGAVVAYVILRNRLAPSG